VLFRSFSEWNERRRNGVLILVLAACFVLAVFAQRRLDQGLVDYPAFLSYGVAGVLLALACGGVALERMAAPDASGPEGVPSKFARAIGPVTALLAVALLGCLDFSGNRFRLLGLILWVGGLGLCLCYLYLSDGSGAQRGWLSALLAGEPLTVPRDWLLLGTAVVVGAALRLHQLDAIPADIGWDLPYLYTDALSILQGEYRVFFPANQGREGLFFYLLAAVARFGALSHFSIKLTSALVGIATIPALYLAGRSMFNPAVGLGAAFLLAVNRWHIILSRSGFRVILLPLCVTLVLYTLARALQSRRLFDFALAGLALGLGLYTYTAFAFAVLAVAAALALWVMAASDRRPSWRSLLPLFTLMVGIALVVYAPLARYAIEHPEQYLQRLGIQVRIVTGDPHREAMTLPLLLENARTSLLMYNVHGDSNLRFNVPFARHFGFVSGVLLVLGLAYALRRWRQGSNSLLLMMFFFLIAPMTLAMVPHEMPNIFRAAGTIGPALILAALPLPAVGKLVRDLSATYPASDLLVRLRMSFPAQVHEFLLPIGRRGLLLAAPTLLAVLLLTLECRETRIFYFRDFAGVLPDRQNVSIAKEIAGQIEAYGDLSSCYIKVWPHWFDGRALRVYLRQPYGRWNPEFGDLVPGQPPLSTITGRGLVITHPHDTEGLQMLRDAFPRHATVVHSFPDGSSAFVAVYVER
jgi:4-amino-4-deoxy-L-arabinose transferase-like glycosyltransferase